MKRRKQKSDSNQNFPIVADMLGVWEEFADDEDISDTLGSYTGNPQDEDLYPEQDADDL